MRTVIAVLLLVPATAAGQLTQPDGRPIPTPPGCDGGQTTGLWPAFACVCDEPDTCNIGERCDPGLGGESCPDEGRNAECESRMWHRPNDDPCIPEHRDGLDPVMDASLEPETFVPTCPLTFTVLTRGTALFDNAFGWYNAGGNPPGPDDLHVMLDCAAAPGSSVVLDIQSEPAWRGGEIGFFLLTPEDPDSGGSCDGGDCCASVDRYRSGVGWVYFSERRLNPEDDPFIHLIVYDSRVWERKFYFAWEDTFNAPNNDFTDLVTGVEGVECSGAGEECATGQPGACGRGLTACEAGELGCVGLAEPSPERCNGIDDDCDGSADEEAGCPDPDAICKNGECVPDCAVAEEFACPIGYECDLDSGSCVEESCRDVDCGEDLLCRGGDCAEACDGIVCPHDRICVGDSCIDPCAGASCGAGEVCVLGLCLAGCNGCGGLVCAPPLACDETTGACADPSCPDDCPTGTFCRQGACADTCDGAVCPRGQQCRDGECVVDGAGGGDGDGDGDGGDEDDGDEGAHCACRLGRPARGGGLAWVIAVAMALRLARTSGQADP